MACSGANSCTILLCFFAFYVLTSVGTGATHLHFYMHDTLSGRSPSAFRLVKGKGAIPGFWAYFGDVVVADDPLTEGPDPKSRGVGRIQGFYITVSHNRPVLLVSLEAVLSEDGPYNGSTISISGRNDITERVRELSVVGGSGAFRMARGYVLWRTHFVNLTSRNAILELDVYATTATTDQKY
ncbi:dirigent protein 1-like [Ananas comosus]|uniref:Dirigent protein n=2 Tax=Ananas comosus TaxID=4615 RepID=A0A199VC93_ANACO|nr:dirigent protein 1-like [Ananas comosus]OAY74638.1 Dirigent protein 1 [Ananas comosus]CAD1843585.1 unnamed protein product [Ananas comosus var. bracteatus]